MNEWKCSCYEVGVARVKTVAMVTNAIFCSGADQCDSRCEG